MPSSTRFNHFIQICPIHLLPFHFNSDALLSIPVLFILLTWPNKWVRFSPYFVISLALHFWRLFLFHNS
jgi:hypothetical protein